MGDCVFLNGFRYVVAVSSAYYTYFLKNRKCVDKKLRVITKGFSNLRKLVLKEKLIDVPKVSNLWKLNMP
jgi:hypothetical protein